MEGRVIGSIALQVDEAHEVAERAYAIRREHWGKGLMLEAAKAVIQWGFGERGLAKIWAKADPPNRRSWRVMEKLGMTREGLLPDHAKVRGERVDDVDYGILREEWESQS